MSRRIKQSGQGARLPDVTQWSSIKTAENKNKKEECVVLAAPFPTARYVGIPSRPHFMKGL